MKISSKQALVLFEIAKWSTRIHGGAAGYSSESIVKLVNDIMNQQDDTIMDLSSIEQPSIK